MTSPRKIVAFITCVAVIGAAAILWPVYRQKAAERKLVEAAKVRAGQGEANAQYSLGNRYRKGEGVPQDDAESVRWFRKAADQGDAQAQYALGYMYREGKGVSRDDAEAVRWYRKAAEQGDRPAQAALAIIYFKGQGVSKDYLEAVYWLGKVAASCFVVTNGAPLEGWLSILVVVFALPMLVVPRRRWGRATWMPWALGSASCGAALAHELLLPASSLALFAREPLGILWRGYGYVVWLAFLAGGSVYGAIGAVVNARRGPKHHALQHLPQ